MHGLDAGELALAVFHFVIDRFNYSRKPTYAYEVAWVFQRDRGTVGHVLKNLEADGDVVRVNPETWYRRTLYLPKLEYAVSWAKPLMPGYEETDGIIESRRKFHDANCPCMRLKA